MSQTSLSHDFSSRQLSATQWVQAPRAIRAVSVLVTAVAVAVWAGTTAAAPQWRSPSSVLWTFAALVVGSAVLARPRVPLGAAPGEHGLSVTVYQSAQFAAAILLPPCWAGMIGLGAPLLALQRPWTSLRVMINGGRGLLSTVAAASVWQSVGGARELREGRAEIRQVVAMTCALAAFAVVERGMNMVVTRLSSGVPLRSSRLLDPLEIADDLSQLAAGGLVALLVVHHPALALAASPMGVLGLLSLALHAERRRADLDDKTRLLTSAGWRQAAEREVARAARAGLTTSVIMIDVDLFRAVNTDLGHLGGDLVLGEVAARTMACLRSYDIAGRFGGEEFALLLPATSLADAHDIAERIRLTIRDAPVIDSRSGCARHVTVSAGVAIVVPGDTLNEGLRRADEALYRAKHAGRDRVCSDVQPQISRMRSVTTDACRLAF